MCVSLKILDADMILVFPLFLRVTGVDSALLDLAINYVFLLLTINDCIQWEGAVVHFDNIVLFAFSNASVARICLHTILAS